MFNLPTIAADSGSNTGVNKPHPMPIDSVQSSARFENAEKEGFEHAVAAEPEKKM